MKKRIFLSLLVVLSLFLITGCGEKNSNSQNDNDNNPIINNNDNENNSQDGNDSEDNLKEKLVGTWEYNNSETGVVDIYIFKSDGTVINKYTQSGNDIASGTREFSSYKYDGNEVSMFQRTSDGDLYSIQMNITLNASSFRDKDTGNVYYKK